ncbi:MAG: PTS fructose transporter subunit IIA [Elusimicrobia bacterium]|nr:PTS fructose transporter subunit IIA [Elusimicrobiota bacterium]
MINIIVMTHGNLGQELVNTATLIIGRQPGVIVLALSGQDSLSTITARTGDILKGMPEQDGTLIFTDMLGGTPCNASLAFAATYPIEIVTGVNLYMLISACTNRMSMNLQDVAAKVIADGKKNIANAKEIFLKRIQ